ncbi:polyketide synthase [Apiospora arundinis]
MVIRDSPFGNITLEDYTAALRCKVGGTWNLHNISHELGLPLDFFTMLSSVSGICGNKGQANYDAASAFLDAFANFRRGLVLLASSVDPGVVSDIGYMADREKLRDRYLMKILRLTEPLDFARPVTAYGIDSLAAVEVLNLLRVELGADLTTLDIVSTPSLLATIRFGVREPANHDFEDTCLVYENTDNTIDLVCEALRKLARKGVLEVLELTNKLISIDLLRNLRQQSGTDGEEEQEEEWTSLQNLSIRAGVVAPDGRWY